MLKKFLAVAVLVIACVSLGVWVGRTQASASGAAGRTSDSPTNSPAPRILPVAVSVGEGLPARKAAAGDVDGRAAKFAGFNALSEADADWLERHGYPTDEESIRYLNMPDNVVAALAERGDRIAAVFEARRELETKGGTEPVDKLLKLASGGSIFALDQLGSVYQAHGGDKLFLAEAYYEVARRLGGRVPVVAVNFKRSLPPYELGLAMEYSQVVLDRMNALRKAQGLSPITYESRPDAELAFAQHFDEYQQLQQAQGKAAAAPASQQ